MHSAAKIPKASNVQDDLELAKQLQDIIDMENAPLKRKNTNPLSPGGYYTKPKQKEKKFDDSNYKEFEFFNS